MVEGKSFSYEDFKRILESNCDRFNRKVISRFHLKYSSPEFNKECCLLLDEILEIEIEAHLQGKFPLFRGGEIGLSSMLVDHSQERLRSVSYGSTLFGGFFLDPNACAFNFMREQEGKKIVLVDKLDYLLGGTSRELFKIPPLNTVASLLSFGEFFHPRTRVPSNDGAKPLRGLCFNSKPSYLYSDQNTLELEEKFKKYQEEFGINLQLKHKSQLEEFRSNREGDELNATNRINNLILNSEKLYIEYVLEEALNNVDVSSMKSVLSMEVHGSIMKDLKFLPRLVENKKITDQQLIELIPLALSNGARKSFDRCDGMNPYELAFELHRGSDVLNLLRTEF